MDYPNQNELAEIGVRELISTPGSRITATVARTPATDANILINAAAAMADEVIGQEIDLEAGTFLDSCTGQALDRYLWDRYKLKRPGATPALNSVFFATASASPVNFTIAQGTIVQTQDGIQYVTIADALYPKGAGQGAATPGIYVAARSVLAGSAQRSVAQVLSVVSQIAGAPSGIALLAVFAVASSGGLDQLDDDTFRQMGRDFFVNSQLGTLPALEARAKQIPGVITARAFEVLSPTALPYRFVTLVIGDAYTDAYALLDQQPPAYAAQSQLLAAAVQQQLSDTRGAGMALIVTMGQVVMLPILLVLRFVAGVDYNAVALAARVAVFNYTNGLAGGDTWSYAGAEAALRTVQGLAWTGQEITSPLGDVLAGSGQLLRTDLRLVTQQGGPNPDTLVLSP